MSLCRGNWKRHAWGDIQPSAFGPVDPGLREQVAQCRRCRTERNPRANKGPLHRSEYKRPRYKTITAAPGYERRKA